YDLGAHEPRAPSDQDPRSRSQRAHVLTFPVPAPRWNGSGTSAEAAGSRAPDVQEARPSSGTPPEEDDLRRVEEHDRVEQRRGVLHVVQVEAELLAGVLEGRAVRVADLRPARDARANARAQVVERDSVAQLGDEFGALGTRAD